MTKKIIILALIFLIASVFSIEAQSLKKMVVEPTTQRAGVAAESCNTPSVGVLIFYSAIDGLEFSLAMSNMLLSQVYNKNINAYVLCVQSSERGIVITIRCTRREYETETYRVVESITANKPQYFIINPKDDESMATIKELKEKIKRDSIAFENERRNLQEKLAQNNSESEQKVLQEERAQNTSESERKRLQDELDRIASEYDQKRQQEIAALEKELKERDRMIREYEQLKRKEFEYKPFRVDLGLGIGSTVDIFLEPKYAVNQRVSFGLKYSETKKYSTGSGNYDYNGTEYENDYNFGSIVATVDFHFRQTAVLRPYVGVGSGWYKIKYKYDEGSVKANNLGFLFRTGFDYKHCRLALTYNMAGKYEHFEFFNARWFNVALAFYLGGGEYRKY